MFSLLLLATVAACYANPSTLRSVPRLGSFGGWSRLRDIRNPSTLRSVPRLGSFGGWSWLRDIRGTTRSAPTGPAPIREEVMERDCESILFWNNSATDGIYEVYPEENMSLPPIRVLCDMTGDGWTMVLKRFQSSTDFNRTWEDMKYQIGRLTEDFWLGLEPVHRLTSSGLYALEVKVRGGPNTQTEIYNTFMLSDEAQAYKLTVEGFNNKSTYAHGVLNRVNNCSFTTRDREKARSHYGICPLRRGPNWLNRFCGAGSWPFSAYEWTTWGPLPLWDHYPWETTYNQEITMKIRRKRP